MSVSTGVDTGMFQTGQFSWCGPAKSLNGNALANVPREAYPVQQLKIERISTRRQKQSFPRQILILGG
jgi:hypothetical protein